ncbi:MAG TPA: condensation domain-containing protein, partial [Longimicrobiaceae bacterium]|nr:condensation domain-containing protein [Longimicrobiaceae bacterium]
MSRSTPEAAVLSAEEKRRLLLQKLQKAQRASTFPLSFAQQRLWLLDRLDPGGSAYNVAVAFRARGELDAGVLRQCLRETVRRHEVLRSVFVEREGRPVQVVGAAIPEVLHQADLRGLGAARREAELRRLAAEAAERPFDLAEGPLLRAAAARLGEAEWVVLFTMHHIVSDGWSMGVLVRELVALYAAFSRGEPSPLPPLRMQYADYALWHRSWLAGEVAGQQAAYWRDALAGAPPLLELPTDRPRPQVASARGASLGVELPAETTAALRALAQGEGATLFMALLGAWQLLLSRYSGQDDVVVGTPVAGRTRSEVEDLIGFFVPTLVLRARVEEGATFRGLLGEVRETTLGAYAHQDLPFERLLEVLSTGRSLAHAPLFQVMFVLQNNEREGLDLGGVELEGLGSGGGAAKFDLTLTAVESGAGLRASLAYRTELFDAATAGRMLEHFVHLLEEVCARPEARLWELPMLGAGERALVLHGWNATTLDFPREDTLHGRFAAQAARTPHALAVLHGEDRLTYAELELRAGRLAARLHALGAGPEARVAVLLDRSVELLVAILGTWKAGGAYVPLDPAYPAERLAHVLSDSGARVAITREGLRAALPPGVQAVCVGEEGLPADPVDGPAARSAVHPENAAYVIYTSGSTGTPRGVVVQHRSVLNLAAALEQAVYSPRGGTAAPRVSVNGPVTFDTSVKQIVQLLSGATLCVIPEEARYDAGAMGSYLRRHAVEVLDCTPAQLRHLLGEGLLEAAGPALSDLLVAGEAIDERLWGTLAELPGVRAWNLYGPTECTVDAALCRVAGERPVLGGAIGNVRLYVMDGHGSPVP